MPHLVIIRHGNTFDAGDTILRVGARTDIALSNSGKTQAQALAVHLAERFPSLAHIYSGALQRQRQTAEAIRGAYTPLPAYTPGMDFLQEIDYGADDGLPEADIITKHGADTLARWDNDNIPPEGWHADAEAIRSGWRAFADTLRDSYPEQAVVFAVTSNGTARFAPEALLPKSDQPDARKLKTCAYGVITLSPDGGAENGGWNLRA